MSGENSSRGAVLTRLRGPLAGGAFRRGLRHPLSFAPLCALGVIYLVALIFRWGPAAAPGWLTAISAAGAVLVLGIESRRSAGQRRDMLRWLALGAVVWCVAGVISGIAHMVSGKSAGASFSIDEMFDIVAPCVVAAGLIVRIRLSHRTRSWVRYAADTYVCAGALFIVGWVALFGSLFHESGESALEFLVDLLPCLVDALLICCLLPIVLGAVRGHRRPSALAYLALVVITAADVLSLAERVHGAGALPSDIVRAAGLIVLAMVAWTGDPGDRLRPVGPGIAPAAAAGAAAVFMAGHSLAGVHRLQPVVFVVAGSAVAVLLVRLGELVQDNDRLRRAVATEEDTFHRLAASLDDVVLICAADGRVRYVSAGVRNTYQYEPDELLGRDVKDVIHPEDVSRVIDSVLPLLTGPGDTVVRVACRVRAADGTWLPTESSISRYTGGHVAVDPDSAGAALLVTTREFSEQAALRRQVDHLTFHDGLTGLPNRAYIEERAQEVVTGGPAAVVFVDLDGFTAVNDSIGHAGGDQVLAQAARRMRSAVAADDTVARWGGDEFAVLVADVSEMQAVIDLADRLLRGLSDEPYEVGGRSLVLTASIGVAFSGTDVGGPELVRNADVALSRAKELGGGRLEVFAASMHADVVRRLELGSDLRRALEEGEFFVEYQPVVELATSRVTGVEALVRWWRGSVLVPPKDFIGPAEESGLIVPLGNWVLREACGQVMTWRRSGWEIGLSVNLRPREIAAPQFVESVAAVLADTGLPPGALTVEVREEVLVEGADEVVARLLRLRDMGVRLAIDDFGTGYASLAYLRQLPVDSIKIDPSFVAGLGRDETLTLLTRTIVRLGRELGLVVVAEGIERPEQLQRLKEMDCPRGQGFLVARPMTARSVEALARPREQQCAEKQVG
jgi:diguanylate cyclase (GGDEF)-like protein/PAS domain S-box-containing protein